MYLNDNPNVCACGKVHVCAQEQMIVGKNAIAALPSELRRRACQKVFILADVHTYAAAGARVEEVLGEAHIPFSKYVYDRSPEPDEAAVGAAVMHFDRSCDVVLAVGSGVIGDISKILAGVSGAVYMIVATAPSMDGYASATSSMTRNGLKVSIPSACASVIIGDINVLKNAPMEMLISGLGDMLAKYISIAEWRISHVVTGEYYCETVAESIRQSLAACVQNAKGLLARDEAAVEAVFKGLVMAGAAMSYAGTSRPASGVEHYFSHLWDMRGVAFDAPVSTHGIQCAVATLIAARLYEYLQTITPERARGLAYAAQFDRDAWFSELSDFLGDGARDMIALEQKERKYCTHKHAERLEIILEHWDELIGIMQAEIPNADTLEALLDQIGCPKTPQAWGIFPDSLPVTFKATKDIRDKYVLSRLAFDLGVLEEMAALCGGEEYRV